MGKFPELMPDDRYNRILVSNVSPPDWKTPRPSGRYNLVVIGAGTAGLVAAAGAAGLGARVALIEKHLLGGDCLNYGCVPSKSIIRSARSAQEVRRAGNFGIRVPDGMQVDFPAVMERMRRLRSKISFHDSARRFRELGADVFLGEARFSGEDSVEVGGQTLLFGKALIASGARPAEPRIEGIREAGYLTSETVFSLTERPERLAVIGGGPIGSELAQAFHRLGSKVTIIHRGDHLLGREDSDAAMILHNSFLREGIQLLLGTKPVKVSVTDSGIVIAYEKDREEGRITVDRILAGVGRSPNVEGLNLEAAGVRYDNKNGVIVNDFLQTTNPRIFAAGDICLKHRFTHTADATARAAIQNALFLGRRRVSVMAVPWTTFTDPEIAHVGMYEQEARERGMEVDTFVRPMGEVDRAAIDGAGEGFVKVHVKRGTDRILGATIVAEHAGEMISEISVAMVRGIGLKAMANIIHPYPTQAEAVRQVADIYNRTRLTPAIKKALALWLRLGRMDVPLALGRCMRTIRKAPPRTHRSRE